MLKWLLRRPLDRFEREFDYDMSYAREILDASPGAMLRFGMATGFTRHREGVPAAAYYAAKIAGTMQEDCGPCTQLIVDMALKDGVPEGVVRAVLTRDTAAMPDDAALGYRYALASLAHEPAHDLREEVVSRWGKKALVSLAFALTAARIFPTLKYALGHGETCVRVKLAGTVVPVK
jgi:uncharacterized lipoprotein YbaY